MDRDVVGLVFAATISTAISASIGVATLSLMGTASQTPFFTLWGTWWVGNLLGTGGAGGAAGANAVPEPGTWLLLLAGGLCIAGRLRRRRA